jgi:hypothetical protein
MIFDKELTFIETEPNALHNLESGQLGRVVCLGASGLGKGRKSSVAIAFKSDTTATGDPKISLELITADTDDFNDSVKIPLSMPTPIKKEQMAEGTVLAAPPDYGAFEIRETEYHGRYPNRLCGACGGVRAGRRRTLAAIREEVMTCRFF